jgi:hypothetical protein
MRLLRENLAQCAQLIKIIGVTFALLFASMLWSTICHIECNGNLVIFKTTFQIITTLATTSTSMYFSYVSYPSNCWLSTKLLSMINYYVNAELTVASKEVPRIG